MRVTPWVNGKHCEFPSIPSNGVESVLIAASDSWVFVSDFKPYPRHLLFSVLLMRCPQSQHAQEATSIATEQCNIKVAFLLTLFIINSTWWTAEHITCLYCVRGCASFMFYHKDALTIRLFSVITSRGLSAQAGQVSSERATATQVWTSGGGNLGQVGAWCCDWHRLVQKKDSGSYI